MIELTQQYGRYGYRRIAVLLREAGWHVNDKRVERLWRREGLKVPIKQPKKRRLWLTDGSCVRLRPEHRNHVWSYDFVHCRTDDGKAFRTLNIIDEYSRECLAIRVDRKLNSGQMTASLSCNPLFDFSIHNQHSFDVPGFFMSDRCGYTATSARTFKTPDKSVERRRIITPTR